MAQHDYNIANASFPTVRSDINDVLSAINSSNSGTSRPSSAVVGTIWLDTTSSATPTLKYYDGAGDISLATLNHSANTVNWLDSTVVADLIGDTSPQLGGDLDVVTHALISTSNRNIAITPNGSGKVVIDGISHPTADGSANQVLTTNGSGVLSFADASGGGTSWQSAVKTANFTAVAGEGYFVNTSGGAFEIDLPGSPSVGDEIEFVDFSRNFATANLTLDQGSNKFQGFTSPKPVYSTNGQNIKIVYSGSTQGWIPLVDDDVTDEVPQAYDIDFLVIAGGGSGAVSHGGGGGAGGYRTSTQSTPSGVTVTVTVGDGGAAISAGGGNTGNNGSNSSISGSGFTTITSTGGGGGACGTITPFVAGLNGGSGGGGRSEGSNTVAAGSGNTPSTSPSQGNNGGAGFQGAPEQAGGGGGAGAVGGTGSSGTAGNGGAGASSSITGSAVTRAGGGGGGARSDAPAAGSGGSGGGGAASKTNANATAGTVNTGGGGGGGGRNNGGNMGASGAGGKGVVIVSMPDADYSGTTSGSPTVATGVSGKTVLTFNSSGSFTT